MMSKALYIHIPFCEHICHYCDFCHYGYQETLAFKWLKAFEKELNERLDFIPKTIYVGGGTPSVLSYDLLESFLKLLKPYINHQEFTFEINPENIDEAKIKLLKQYGSNRISIGVQSSDPQELKLLGRQHSFERVKEVIRLLKFHDLNNISVDAMYSLPKQQIDTFRRTLTDLLNLEVPHISLYALTIEEKTLFGRRGYQNVDADLEADMYQDALDYLALRGYENYEISNFAFKGYQSEHNKCYWHYEDFLGLSLGAASKYNHCRYENTANLKDYLEGKWTREVLELERREEMFEFIMMNLRLREGMSLKRFENYFKEGFLDNYLDTVNELLNEGQIILENDYLIVKNRALLNEILLRFMDYN